MIKQATTLVVLALLAKGCATTTSVPPALPTANTGTSQEVKCERSEQPGCLSIDMMNVEYDPEHPLMATITEDYWKKFEDEELRRYLALKLGPLLFQCYKDKECNPAAGVTEFRIYFWNPLGGSAENFSAYEVPGPTGDPKTMQRIAFEEFTPDFRARFVYEEEDLGQPDRSFRLETSTVGGELNVDWSMMGPETWVLICSSNVQRGRESVVYPPVAEGYEQGLWLSPTYLAEIKLRGWGHFVAPAAVVVTR